MHLLAAKPAPIGLAALAGRIAHGPESLLDSYTGTFLILTMHLAGRIAHGPESLPDFQNTTFMTAQFLETKQGSYFILDT
jgi:hypothetical protein